MATTSLLPGDAALGRRLDRTARPLAVVPVQSPVVGAVPTKGTSTGTGARYFLTGNFSINVVLLACFEAPQGRLSGVDRFAFEPPD